jgi:hydrogenase maturation protein HypF
VSTTADRATRSRIRIRVQGTVQGVGFRPYVYQLASQLALDGYVLNDAEGVLLEVEGPDAALGEFIGRLVPEAPPLARVERILSEKVVPHREEGFTIRASPAGQTPNAPVTVDTATCAECLRELLDPGDRRYRYPFINCTNCGPRFTIIRGVPYDRPLTTMAEFTMCPSCRFEYDDPADRRFHAQPNACPRCGPSVRLLDRAGVALPAAPRGADPVLAAAAALREGMIVAVKGVGGYHLACRADDADAVARLRARKHREDKPFALMAPDLPAAERLVVLDGVTRELLCCPQRPIVLAPRRRRAPVARSVAPGALELGVMLPYSPLHHLLLADCASTLVLTSGNVSDEPICFRDEEALQRLSAIADLFLVHDRPIETRTDDSVVRLASVAGEARVATLRRSRGYVPGSLRLPGDGAQRPLLACGAELKNTFCLAKGERAWVSHHIGDLENLETLRSFSEGVQHFQRLFAVEPDVVAYDLHPEYLSTKYALERDGVQLIGVQHHHAHMAACLAEHGEMGRAVGAIFDGQGYGSDDTLWGGELLYGHMGSFRRVGSLHPVRLPGGAQAIRQPWRMACAWLQESRGAPPELPPTLADRVDPDHWSRVAQLARTGLASPQTTSAGRLFDAVAALCGLRAEIRYEGQAAIELEAACDPDEHGSYPMPVIRACGATVIDPRETIAAVSTDVRAGESVGTVAARFHRAMGLGTIEACVQAASENDTEIVVLSGGVFLNRRLLETVAAGLTDHGLRVLTPQLLPAGDGGISYGQAAVAAWRSAVR